MATIGVTEMPVLSPHVDLQEKSELAVEEVAQLVHAIKEYQEIRLSQHEQILNGYFQNEDALKAQGYLQQLDKYIGTLWEKMAEATEAVPQNFCNIMKWLHAQSDYLDQQILAWKRQQRTALMGGPADELNNQLAILKLQFETLENLAWSLQKQSDRYSLIIHELSEAYRQCKQFMLKCKQMAEDCEKRRKEVKSYIAALVQKSMIVYQQPPSILRRPANSATNQRQQKNAKIPFDMEIRFLAGEKSGLLRANIELEALLISEQQAREIVNIGNPVQGEIATVGKINYPVCILQAPTSVNEGYMSAKFSGARIQAVERAAEDDGSRVLYHVLFRAKMNRTANGSVPYYSFWALSLPFSVVVNASRQERYRRALMFWVMAYGVDDKTSLALQFDELIAEKSCRWPDFFCHLNYWFKKMVGTQKGLEENENYIMEIIGAKEAVKQLGGEFVTWDMFYTRKADQGPTKGLKFWDWIYPVADYLSRFPHYWDSGLVLGLAPRPQVEQMLYAATEPSMVMKFSDGHPGKMVVSYVEWTGNAKKVEHIMFDEDEQPAFANKSFVECIKMSNRLQNITRILPSNRHVHDLYTLESPSQKPSKPGNKKQDGYVRPSVTFVWGEPPTPPVWQYSYESNAAPQDDYTDTSNITPAANFDNYTSFQNWISGPSVSSDTTSQHSYMDNNAFSVGSIESNQNSYLTASPMNFLDELQLSPGIGLQAQSPAAYQMQGANYQFEDMDTQLATPFNPTYAGQF